MTKLIKSFAQYKEEYAASVENPEKFWADKAEQFTWTKKWDKVLEWDFVSGINKWFLNGKTNISFNALDRHLETQGDKPAIIWEPRFWAEVKILCLAEGPAPTVRAISIELK